MTTPFPPDLIQLLQRACLALGPYRGQAVLVGGLVPFVYRHHPAFDHTSPVPPLGTKDADMAVPLPLVVRDGVTLCRRLEAGGLVAEVGRDIDGQDSVTRFFLPERRSAKDPYLEFLVRDPGRWREMEGRPQTDLRAHTVDFLDLLVDQTWTITVPGIGDIDVPHPTGYVAQKTRIADRRGPKWAKDQGDVVLVIWAFHSLWDDMASVWRGFVQRHPHGVWLKGVLAQWRRFYASPRAEGALAVAEIYRQTATINIPASAIHKVMSDFMARLGSDGSRS